MRLLELFDKVIPTTKDTGNWGQPGREQYNFTTPNGQEVSTIFIPDGQVTEVMFSVGDHKDSMNITGAGEEIIIFSTVLAEIKKYAAANPQQTITFSADADEPSRVKLYDRMLKNIPNIEREEEGDEVFYTILPRTGQQ